MILLYLGSRVGRQNCALRARSRRQPGPRRARSASRSAAGRARAAARRRRRRPARRRSRRRRRSGGARLRPAAQRPPRGRSARPPARSSASRSIALRRAAAIATSPAGASSPSRKASAGSTARKRSVEATATPRRCGQPICSSPQASETISQTQLDPRLVGGEQAIADVVEVLVEGRRRDPGDLRDPGARRPHVAPLGENLGGRPEQAPALVLGDRGGRDPVAPRRQPKLGEGPALPIGLPVAHGAAG